MKTSILCSVIFLLNTFSAKAQWQVINTGSSAELYGVACISKDIVIVCGDHGTILKTIDGGSNWEPKVSGTGYVLEGIKMRNNVGYIWGKETNTSENCLLLKTMDLGETWNIQNPPFASNVNIMDMFMIDADTLYASLSSGKVVKSTDGGYIWNEKLEADISSLFFMDEVGYALDRDILYKSIDYGNNWSEIVIDYESSYEFIPLRKIYFNDKENGEIMGGERLFSTDGFNSYNAQSLPWQFTEDPYYYFSPAKIKYLQSGIGCAIAWQSLYMSGEVGNILITRDGGGSWYFNFCRLSSLYDIDGAGDSTFYITTSAGNILKANSGYNKINNYEPISENLIAYPNPTMGRITVEYSGQLIMKVEIYDIMGKKVMELYSPGSNPIYFDISGLQSGMYAMKVITKDGFGMKKIIKQ